ncbi:MAG: monofunctional biosynthetic peptidoglycan transglycosylase [Deltaproteobacteria bacterium]|nr:monofunctional biosynthetic peptidoglycan transglycosylase [Deltaproteobacteria bacterium]
MRVLKTVDPQFRAKRHTPYAQLFIGLVTLSFFLILLVVAYILWMPNLSKLKKENPKKTALMEYREKTLKEKVKKYRVDQSWVPYSKISPYLIKAVLIAEDDKFWNHEGFDYEAIQKAIEKDLKAKKFKFGGSTITQQLARNLFLSPEKTMIRKFSEAVITWRMEKVLSKRRILELYLNVAEWGEGIFGAEAASRHYFGKPSSELNPAEAARLAAILPNPRRYRPMGDQRYVINRSNLIYNIMIRRGIVIPEYEEIYQEVTESSESSSPEETVPEETISDAPVSKEEDGAEDR